MKNNVEIKEEFYIVALEQVIYEFEKVSFSIRDKEKFIKNVFVEKINGQKLNFESLENLYWFLIKDYNFKEDKIIVSEYGKTEKVVFNEEVENISSILEDYFYMFSNLLERLKTKKLI